MTCEKKRKLALAIIEDFCACVKPLEQELERGIIHGDFNEQVFEAKMEIQMLCKHMTFLLICFQNILVEKREKVPSTSTASCQGLEFCFITSHQPGKDRSKGNPIGIQERKGIYSQET